MPAQPAFPPRLVREGVPKIGFHRHCSPLPGSLFACLEYLGDPYSYDYLMGVTGAAFRRLFQRDDGGNIDLMHFQPEPYVRAFRALGYHHRVVTSESRAAMLAAVQESLVAGRPVLAFGIIGPPECGLVAGYDRGGDVLIGYSYFQDASLPGYYEKADWYEGASWAGKVGFITLGEKTTRPPERETLISTLEWALALARTPRWEHHPEHAAGLAAYDAWADALEVDADYPPGNTEVLGWRVMIQGDQAMMTWEREQAAGYLRSMVEVAPEAAAPLEAAAAAYEKVREEGPRIWLWDTDMGPNVQAALAKPEIRRQLAQHVRIARRFEEQAAEHLASALAAMG